MPASTTLSQRAFTDIYASLVQKVGPRGRTSTLFTPCHSFFVGSKSCSSCTLSTMFLRPLAWVLLELIWFRGNMRDSFDVATITLHGLSKHLVVPMAIRGVHGANLLEPQLLVQQPVYRLRSLVEFRARRLLSIPLSAVQSVHRLQQR